MSSTSCKGTWESEIERVREYKRGKKGFKGAQKYNNIFFQFQLQYEFLHRAILNYAELHNLMEDS